MWFSEESRERITRLRGSMHFFPAVVSSVGGACALNQILAQMVPLVAVGLNGRELALPVPKCSGFHFINK